MNKTRFQDLPQDEKETVMADFASGRKPLLATTTVIEVGIDIPNATLMIIEDADRFGLSQLHQLRGRVGRSNRQAYAYLLTPHPRAMTRDDMDRVRDDFVAATARAEAAGFDSVFTIEFFNRHGYVPLGAIAQALPRPRRDGWS